MALGVQDACNLSGVLHAWDAAVRRLRELLPDSGTDAINTHCVNYWFSDKCASLTGSQFGSLSAEKYDELTKLANSD